jgi:molybdate transport system substrate-binding protein
VRRLAVAALLTALLTACSGDGGGGDSITVIAAASLTEAFTEIGAAFEAEHDGVDVTFSFGGSSSLVEQANQGVRADVLVTADRPSMERAESAEAATVVAHNRLAILVEPGNPKGITGLADLARTDVVLVVCAPEVPCGRIAAAALERAGVDADPASLEESVKGVVSKVTLGEADAGLVYVTDVDAAGRRGHGVAIDTSGDPALVAEYLTAVLDQSRDADLAQAFVDFVAGPAGQLVLASYGFLPPTDGS